MRGLVVHVGLADVNEMAGPRVELLEVVGGEVEALPPIVSEPLDVALDRVDVLVSSRRQLQRPPNSFASS